MKIQINGFFGEAAIALTVIVGDNEDDVSSVPINTLNIRGLNMPTRINNALAYSKIHTIERLLRMTELELLKLTHIGPTAVEEIQEALEFHGFPPLAKK